MLALVVIAVAAQGDELADKRRHRRLCQRVARGDVHVLHFVGQTVDDGGQQALVA